MAQLTDDCFAFGGALTPVDEAVAAMLARVAPVTAVETVALAQARGRILAQDLVSARAVPPHDNAAVDGYAVFHADLNPAAETRLPLAGRAAAGHPLPHPQVRGTAVRIFTGAPMPVGEEGAPGPDTVMMQEDAQEEGDHVVLRPGLKRGSNRRKAGEDVAPGTAVLAAGRRLKPQDLGLAASIGETALAVRTPLKVAVFSTGDELLEAGAELPLGAVYDANRPVLTAMLAGLGCAVTDLGILADRPEVVRGALAAAAAGHDLIMTSGGVSGGDEDHVKGAVEALGSLYLWRMAIKPGRPVALGQVARVPFCGLPGNPVAAMVTFIAVARPLIQVLSGEAVTPLRGWPVTAGFAIDKKAGRREYLRVTLVDDPDRPGVKLARRFPRDGAGILSSMVAADGLLVLDEAITDLPAGATLPFLSFAELGL